MSEPLRVAGALHRSAETEPDQLRRVLAEQYAERLLDALTDAVMARAHWRGQAMKLLQRIDAGIFPKPRQ